MNKIKILDCTLRDGGYINKWQFGNKNIKSIITKLVEANIDIIECGFITDKKERSNDSSLFDTVARVTEFLPKKKDKFISVCMINYGKYDIKNIPQNDHTSIDGIRVAFHKKDRENALMFCKGIVERGYKLFIQPMVSVSYSDQEFIDLIVESNKIKPYAFYIVDSFGVMKRKDLMRLYYLVDHNLNDDIYIGYHSHNNIQMAYSNAQALVNLKARRKLIIDSSVFGMGRGAGNLNTELFIQYINEIYGVKYKSEPLLQIIDEILEPIYQSKYWGYSLPHYISAIHNCHPNYASYLDNKNTLTIENINEIICNINENKKNNYDKEYIESLYNEYQTRLVSDENAMKELTKLFKGKTVIVIAPGSSINTETDKILKAISQPNTLTVSINFNHDLFKSDYVFVSNLRRFDNLKDNKKIKFIVTSNIKYNKINGYIVNYSNLINYMDAVQDNAGMMLIKLLINLNVKDIKIAGLDGYSCNIYKNYANRDMAFLKSNSVMDAMNSGMSNMLTKFSKNVKITFLTSPRFVKLGVE